MIFYKQNVNNKFNPLLSIFLIIAMISWGVSWASAKIIGQYINPINAIFLRFLFSATTLIPVVFFLKQKLTFKKIPLMIIIVSSILLAIYNFCFFKGTKLGEAGIGGVLVTATNPIITIVFMAFIDKRKLIKKEILGLLGGIIGSALIVDIVQQDLNKIFQSGNVYFILCSIIWSVLTVFTSKKINQSQFINFIFFTYMGVAIITLPLIEYNDIIKIINFDFKFWIHFLIVSIGALAFGTTIYFLANSRLGPQKSSSYIFTVPIIAIITSYLLLDEQLTLSSSIGSCLAISAVIIINKR